MFIFVKKLKGSIIEKKFIRSVVSENLKDSFKYFFILIFIVISIYSVRPLININEGINVFTTFLETNSPDFKFENGEFEFYGEMPYIEKTDTFLLYIDTNLDANTVTLPEDTKGMLITKNEILYRKNMIEERIYDLNKFSKAFFTKSKLLNLINKYNEIFLALFFVVILIFIILSKIFGLFFFSLFGILLNKIHKKELCYNEILKISIYSISLPTIIKLSTSFQNEKIQLFYIIYYSIGAYYINRHIKNYKTETFEEN